MKHLASFALTLLALCLPAFGQNPIYRSRWTTNADGTQIDGSVLTNLPVATTASNGVVRPDGSTVTIAGGIITAHAGGSAGIALINGAGTNTSLFTPTLTNSTLIGPTTNVGAITGGAFAGDGSGLTGVPISTNVNNEYTSWVPLCTVATNNSSIRRCEEPTFIYDNVSNVWLMLHTRWTNTSGVTGGDVAYKRAPTLQLLVQSNDVPCMEPVAGTQYSNYVSGPVIYTEGTNFWWATTFASSNANFEGGPSSIYLWVAPYGTPNFTLISTNPIISPVSGWNGYQMFRAMIFKRASTYHILVNGKATSAGLSPETIGHYTATGLSNTWTADAGNPILSNSQYGVSWDSQRIGDAFVLPDRDIGFYYGASSNANTLGYNGLFLFTNGSYSTPYKWPGNPIHVSPNYASPSAAGNVGGGAIIRLQFAYSNNVLYGMGDDGGSNIFALFQDSGPALGTTFSDQLRIGSAQPANGSPFAFWNHISAPGVNIFGQSSPLFFIQNGVSSSYIVENSNTLVIAHQTGGNIQFGFGAGYGLPATVTNITLDINGIHTSNLTAGTFSVTNTSTFLGAETNASSLTVGGPQTNLTGLLVTNTGSGNGFQVTPTGITSNGVPFPNVSGGSGTIYPGSNSYSVTGATGTTNGVTPILTNITVQNITFTGNGTVTNGSFTFTNPTGSVVIGTNGNVTASGIISGSGAGLSNLTVGNFAGTPQVILNVNMQSDWEDASGLTFAAKLHAAGKIRLLAVIVDGAQTNLNSPSLSSNILSVPAASAILAFNGAGSVPIGAWTNTQIGAPTSVVNGTYPGGIIWPNYIATNFYQPCTNVDNASRVLRRVLAAATNNSVLFFNEQPFTVLYDLLHGSADDISSLTTLQLFNQKVRRIGGEAGDYPNGMEYNFYVDPASAQWVQTNQTVGMYLMGFSLGAAKLSAPDTYLQGVQDMQLGWTNYQGSNDPIYNLRYATDLTGDAPRTAWITASMLALIWGNTFDGQTLWTNLNIGSNQIYANGSNFFNSGVNNNDGYFSGLNTNVVSNLVSHLLYYPIGTERPRFDTIGLMTGGGLSPFTAFFNVPLFSGGPLQVSGVGKPGSQNVLFYESDASPPNTEFWYGNSFWQSASSGNNTIGLWGATGNASYAGVITNNGVVASNITSGSVVVGGTGGQLIPVTISTGLTYTPGSPGTLTASGGGSLAVQTNGGTVGSSVTAINFAPNFAAALSGGTATITLTSTNLPGTITNRYEGPVQTTLSAARNSTNFDIDFNSPFVQVQMLTNWNVTNLINLPTSNYSRTVTLQVWPTNTFTLYFNTNWTPVGAFAFQGVQLFSNAYYYTISITAVSNNVNSSNVSIAVVPPYALATNSALAGSGIPTLNGVGTNTTLFGATNATSMYGSGAYGADSWAFDALGFDVNTSVSISANNNLNLSGNGQINMTGTGTSTFDGPVLLALGAYSTTTNVMTPTSTAYSTAMSTLNSGFTNTQNSNAVYFYFGTSGSAVLYWSGGSGARSPIITNAIVAAGGNFPLQQGCGVQITSGVGVQAAVVFKP